MHKNNLFQLTLLGTALVLNVLFAYAALDLFLPKFEMLSQSAAAEILERSLPYAPGQPFVVPRVGLSAGSFWILWAALTLIGVTIFRRRPEVLAPFAYCGGVSLLVLATFGEVNPAVRFALLAVGQLFVV